MSFVLIKPGLHKRRVTPEIKKIKLYCSQYTYYLKKKEKILNEYVYPFLEIQKENPEDIVLNDELKTFFLNELLNLDRRSRIIICLTLGLYGYKQNNLRDIGIYLNMSHQNVKLIKNKTINTIKIHFNKTFKYCLLSENLFNKKPKKMYQLLQKKLKKELDPIINNQMSNKDKQEFFFKALKHI